MRHDVDRIVGEILQPLLEADGGGVEVESVVESTVDGGPLVDVVLHLTGSFRGCPSTPLVQRSVIEPALRKGLGVPVRVKITPVPSIRPSAPVLTERESR